MAEKNKLYPDKYGVWAGNPAGRKPDFTRCCEGVYDETIRRSYQCARKRGHGPDGAYCKQHDPVAKSARRAASEAKWAAKWAAERYQIYGRSFYDALNQIAGGHNDARGLAQEVIDKFHEGERK